MSFLLTTVSFLIIITKFFDCYTTHRYMQHVEQERNNLARKWMTQFGKENVIWFVFVITIIITCISLWQVLTVYTAWYWQFVYIFMALVVSFTQAAVAHSNYTGKQNKFTLWLMRTKHYRR